MLIVVFRAFVAYVIANTKVHGKNLLLQGAGDQTFETSAASTESPVKVKLIKYYSPFLLRTYKKSLTY